MIAKILINIAYIKLVFTAFKGLQHLTSDQRVWGSSPYGRAILLPEDLCSKRYS